MLVEFSGHYINLNTPTWYMNGIIVIEIDVCCLIFHFSIVDLLIAILFLLFEFVVDICLIPFSQSCIVCVS